MMNIIGMILAVILFILGFAGTVLPILPGAPLIWLGMFFYGLLTGFARISTGFYIWQGLAVTITFLVDYVTTAYGTRKYGGSSAAVLGGVIGLLVGPFILGIPGIIIGPFLGALAGEALKGRHLESAFKVAFGTLVGFIGGTLLKFIIEVVMVIWFFWTVFRG